jgi:hypothetical protein
MGPYEKAVQQLCQSPIATFIAERKRLAAEVRARGDEAGAARIASRPKPVTSVWAVNQLYWQAQDEFQEMLAAAARLRRGDRGAAKAYQSSIANLRKRAGILLKEAGYGASDATLRRVATTLAAIAAAGGFDPDPPGALAADRDPPGFEAVVMSPPAKSDLAADRNARESERRHADLRAAEEKERKKREVDRARRKEAERSRIKAAVRAATSELRARERAHTSLEKQLRESDEALGVARDNLMHLERRLADLEREE